MPGYVRILVAMLVGMFITVSNAGAFHGRFSQWFGSSASSYSYSYAPPIYYYCPPAAPMVVPIPSTRAPWAVPTPAPPSGSVEPPMGDRLPKIISRSGGSTSSKDLCRVGFWNLTGHDVTVTIEGKAMSLRKNQVLTFDMDREFTWQIAGQPQHVERVAANQKAHEVIIRE